MSVHDVRLFAPGRSLRQGSHALGALDAARLGRRVVVFTPAGAEIDRLIERARVDIAEITSPAIVRRVANHNPDTIWAIARRRRYSVDAPRGEGFLAFLMLNAAGLAALAEGTLDTADPDLALLAAQGERPAGIYVWAAHAPGVLVGGVPLAFERVWLPAYRDVDLYSRAVTSQGFAFLAALGFEAGATVLGRSLPHLHVYRRAPAPTPVPAIPAVRVAVARTVEDLMRVVSIRSAVYLAEQECPYEEEYDGNDLCATHLIGYVGDEPAGCCRLRFFAGFAKLERLALRHEFRGGHGLAARIVEAGIEHCRLKGYATIYGQAQTRLVPFWARHGFRVPEGARALVFSDFDYVEVRYDAPAPHPRAVTLEADPYVIIRPEGRWHEPGILDRSRARPVTRPSGERRISEARTPEERTPEAKVCEVRA